MEVLLNCTIGELFIESLSSLNFESVVALALFLKQKVLYASPIIQSLSANVISYIFYNFTCDVMIITTLKKHHRIAAKMQL